MKHWITIALLLIALRVTAHEVRPAFLELTERAPGEFDVLWKVPAMGGTPLAGEELPHPQPVLADKPGATKTMPCGCPVPTAAQLSRGVLPIHPSLPKDAVIVAPPHPFTSELYVPRFQQEIREAQAEVARAGAQSNLTGKTASGYLSNTVLLASVLFFAGTASKFDQRYVRWASLAFALALFLYAGVRTLLLPVA